MRVTASLIICLCVVPACSVAVNNPDTEPVPVRVIGPGMMPSMSYAERLTRWRSYFIDHRGEVFRGDGSLPPGCVNGDLLRVDAIDEVSVFFATVPPGQAPAPSFPPNPSPRGVGGPAGAVGVTCQLALSGVVRVALNNGGFPVIITYARVPDPRVPNP